jgi:hypothetical protein
MKLEYEVASKRLRNRFGATFSTLNRNSTLMYPYVKGQRIDWFGFYNDCLLFFGRWELNIALDYRKGSFSERNEVLNPVVSTPYEYAYQHSDSYNYENEYLTAPRLGALLGLRYNIKHFYIDLSARYEHGFNLKYVYQPNRIAATMSVGYNF